MIFSTVYHWKYLRELYTTFLFVEYFKHNNFIKNLSNFKKWYRHGSFNFFCHEAWSSYYHPYILFKINCIFLLPMTTLCATFLWILEIKSQPCHMFPTIDLTLYWSFHSRCELGFVVHDWLISLQNWSLSIDHLYHYFE